MTGSWTSICAGRSFLTQAVARRWLGAPARVRRSIINIGSINTVAAAVDRAEYCFSKAGVGMMTKLFALRLAEAGVAVFEIRPGVDPHGSMTAVATARNTMRRSRPGWCRRGAGVSLPISAAWRPHWLAVPFHYSSGEVVYVDGGLHIPAPVESAGDQLRWQDGALRRAVSGLVDARRAAGGRRWAPSAVAVDAAGGQRGGPEGGFGEVVIAEDGEVRTGFDALRGGGRA